jgi:nitrate reductase gamma subunit
MWDMSTDRRLSRPVYEALPWIYVVCGLGALAASYLQPSHAMSFVIGIPGLVAVVGGIAVMLRRRDFRKMRASYNADDLLGKKRND